jgi:hypothetical protein
MDSGNDPYGGAAIFAVLAIFGLLFFFVFVVFYVIASFFMMRIFDKAGVQGKWRAWVPVYNTMIMGKLGDVSPWVVLGAFIASGVLGQIPAIGFIFGLLALAVSVMYSWRVGQKLGKEWYYLLLWLIPGLGTLIWLGILAFDGSRWNDRIPPAPWANSFIADKTVWDGIPRQASSGGYAAPAAPGYPATGAYPPPPAGYTPPPAGYPAPGGPASPPPAAQPPATPPAAQPPTEPPAPPTEEPPAPPAEPPRV